MHVHLLEADFGKPCIWRPKEVLYGYGSIRNKQTPINLISVNLAVDLNSVPHNGIFECVIDYRNDLPGVSVALAC